METQICAKDFVFDCKREVNSPELLCSHNISNNDFNFKEQLSKRKKEFDFCHSEKELLLKRGCREGTSNDSSFCEEKMTNCEIKNGKKYIFQNYESLFGLSHRLINSSNDCNREKQITIGNNEDEIGCKERKLLEFAYIHDYLNDGSFCKKQMTGAEIKTKNKFFHQRNKNSFEIPYNFSNSVNDTGFEEKKVTNDCAEETVVVEVSKGYYMSDHDSNEEENETSFSTTDICDLSSVGLSSERDTQTQSDSSDYFNDETLAIFEPIVKCEISEDPVVLNETQSEPLEKCKIQEKPVNGEKSRKNLAAPIKCHLCDATFKSKKRYETHLEKHSVNEKVECNMCGKAFPYNRFLRHIMIHTGEKPHVCKICGRGFRLKRDLKQHSFTHTGERPYPCKMCGKKFADSSARRKHYQTHTGEKPYTCEICQRAFTQISHLREHHVTHTREKGHTCDMCEKKFTTKSSLQRHVLTHINCCEICSETFTTSTKLERHKELHDISRPYSCPYCTRRFVKKTDVNTHILIHSEVKDIICTICNGAFKSYRYLRVHHYHYHTGMEPPFICPVCKKGFFQEMSLQKHSVAHTPKKRVKCFECKKVFATPEVLEEHICILDSYFDCEFCDRKYRHKSDLNKHIRKFHK